MKPEQLLSLRIFRRAAKEIPAYRRFLKSHRVSPRQIRTVADFSRLPVMDKNNYLRRHALFDLVPPGQLPPFIHASTGSSGQPTFWFRGDEQEQVGGRLHEIIFRDVMGIKKNQPTLVVVCFSMGIWVAGGYTLSSCRYLSKLGYNLTIMTPGYDKHDIIDIINKFKIGFNNIVLAGHPPFIMDVVREITTRKIQPRARIKLLTAGDKFTEQWRDAVLRLLGNPDPYRTIVNLYGSSEANIMGFETPLSIFIRRTARNNPALREKLFGNDAILPVLVQSDPSAIYFEQQKGELLVTAPTAIPLIRYNIHDLGQVFTYEEVAAMLAEYGLAAAAQRRGLKQWRWPFVVKGNRSDVAVTFYALNIYPEHIRSGLEQSNLARFVSGGFLAYHRSLHRHRDQQLIFEIELKAGTALNKKTAKLISDNMLRNLLRQNNDFRHLYRSIGQRAAPRIILRAFGKLRPQPGQALFGLAGKKAKLLGANS